MNVLLHLTVGWDSVERLRKVLSSGFCPFRRDVWVQGITYNSDYHYWFSLFCGFFFLFGKQRKGKRVFWITLFHIFFLYSTFFLKLEDLSKPGLLLLMKGGISSLPFKGFWHSSSLLCFKISLSNSRDCSDSELQCYYQKATICFSWETSGMLL